MYNRLMRIENKFTELGETLSNGKVIGNFLHVMFTKMRRQGYMSAMEAV
jgi:hypothetical protein